MTDAASPRARATADQRAAADPAVSAFVAASAGSGKTKLLTDRLLRLMLGGAAPERILCLTFTKAAAAEMALRLQDRLGRWVTRDDAALAEDLAELDIPPTEAARAAARRLFARVLDLPGGMRIGTIHAFCQSLLRRFPLEAALSPHFQVVEDRDAADALAAAREDMLAAAQSGPLHAALGTLAGLISIGQFELLVGKLQSDRERLAAALTTGATPENPVAGLIAVQRRVLGVRARDDAALLAAAVAWPGEPALRAAAADVQARGSAATAARAERLLGWLGCDGAARVEAWSKWTEEFLTKEGGPRADGAFVNKALATAAPDLLVAFADERARVVAVEDARRALAMAAVSAALATLAVPVAQGYAARMEASGRLDYDDLIGRTSGLLIDPGAAWVLYKLDGGIDHLLLDEVQDTAPAQWRIAHALTAEFFAGAGARETARTVFAVGDVKQSIYSFQGAEAAEFDRARALLRARVTGAGATWVERPLEVSFRSTAPVLDLVDRVFADPIAAAGVTEPGKLRHFADRAGQAGAVELWPLAPPPEETAPAPWTVPEQNHGQNSAPQRLAETLAGWLRARIGTLELPGRGRTLRAGDVMILVRRRNDFTRSLLRALKGAGVPVAGLDRMVLTAQPAVADLIALAEALLLPQDDLTFACYLTSPLGGLTDADLMALAPDRTGSLAEALRARAGEHATWERAWAGFATLLARVDYASPHALLAEALGPLGGRARLFARLGAEAGEPVDELLAAALDYGRTHPPSLQGFLHWLRRSGAEVKREQEAAGEAVRILTVHGAKGLQAPLVILPDTTALPPADDQLLWAEDPASGAAVPLWSPRKEFRCAAGERLRQESAAKRREEHNRLLYVALTRAEDRLLVCGWAPRRRQPETCWYEMVRRGFAALPATAAPFAAWEGEALSWESPQTAPPKESRAQALVAPVPPPAWIGTAPDWRPAPPPPEPARPQPLAPSRPEGVALGPVPAADSPLADWSATGGKTARFQRGRLLHALLQHLPAVAPAQRAAAARAWLARPGHGLTDPAAAELAAEVLAVLDHPDLAPLFGPDSRAEVPLSGVVGETVIGGLVDRLAVLPDRVLIADFKTNRRPPASPEETPVAYLRQMAAYRAVLAQVFPGREVRCTLIWTAAGRAMTLADALLDPHAPGA